MSEPLIQPNPLLTVLRDNNTRLKQTETKETPPLYLPWVPRAGNPIAATAGWGDMAQPWPVNLLAFSCAVFVNAPNNATNFWTLTLINAAGATLATLSTAAIAAGAWTRLSTNAITQPAAANPSMAIVATTTLAPGTIYIVPTLALLRTGN